VVRWVEWAIAASFRTRASLVAENICLRQQLLVLRRHQTRPRIRDTDRRFWVVACRWFAGWRRSLLIVKPETVLRWHRRGWRAYWRWRSTSRGKPGRPPIAPELRELIRRMAIGNRLWFVECCSWDRDPPRFLIHDRDGRYGAAFDHRVSNLGITQIRTPFRSPQANSTAERWIGSLRRECLDYAFILNERHLRKVLAEYVQYFNRWRPHRAIDQRAPCAVDLPVFEARHGEIIGEPVLGGLHHVYHLASYRFGSGICAPQPSAAAMASGDRRLSRGSARLELNYPTNAAFRRESRAL